MHDFIEAYDNAFDDTFCDSVVEKFERNSAAHTQGRSSSGVNKKIKDTSEIIISSHPDWQQINQKISEVTMHYLGEYIREYNHMLFGLMGTGNKMLLESTNQPVEITCDLIKKLPTSDIVRLADLNFTLAPVNMQKYEKGKGGYHKWHSEISPTHPQCEILHRVLLTIIYLNDVDEGGETEFFYQKRSVKPKKGTIVIAPAGFTHTHKGHVPLSSDKYIFASWIKFKRYEAMINAPAPAPIAEPRSILHRPIQ
jgi:hypothetical protein